MGKPRLSIVPKQKLADEEIQFRTYDHIEPGEYPAFSRAFHVYRDGRFGRWVFALQLDILDDALMKTIARLTFFANLGQSPKPRATSRMSHYWRAWIDANGGKMATKSQGMQPDIFLRRMCRVEVCDVAKDSKQVSYIEGVYSKVKRILQWETGPGP